MKLLVSMSVCEPGETLQDVDIAGQGNMNLVLRVTTDRRSVIVKQARPWVEKYPSIAAPDQRVLAEIDFYRCVSQSIELRKSMPAIIADDVANRLLVLEDLGQASDHADLYRENVDSAEVDQVFESALSWVTQLHRFPLPENLTIGCRALRELNHEHMFVVPLQDPPATDLEAVCPGLKDASRKLCTDPIVGRAMQRLGDIYLSDGGCLLHGDYYPGSWLKTKQGLSVIDPEFCFRGPREFDLGILAAHWIFCGQTADETTIDRVIESVDDQTMSRKTVIGFAGSELIRRLLGVGQLPLQAGLDLRLEWLACGVRFVNQFEEKN